MSPQQIEQYQKAYDAEVAKFNEELKATHQKKEFTFSVVEKRRLVQQDLIQKFATQAITDLIQLVVFPRLNLPSDGTVLYFPSVELGKITVFIAKEPIKEEPLKK